VTTPRPREPHSILVYCADIPRCPPELHGRDDALAEFFVLHHLADLRQAFASMARLLRPGGRVVFLRALSPQPPLLS